MGYSPMQLAEAFLRTGELTDALDALNQQLAQEPTDDTARRMRIALLIQLSDDKHLRLALEDCNQLANPLPADFTRRSIILEKLDDLPGALLAMELVRRNAPQDERAVERTLHLLLAQGETQKARQLLEERPKTWQWLERAGDLAAQSGEPATAVLRYTEALALLEESFDLQTNIYARALMARLLLARADSHRRLEQLAEAEADYRQAEAVVPDEPIIPFSRGLLAFMRGELPLAVELCGNALQNANETLRAQMRKTLAEPRYAALAEQLKQP